MRRNEKYDWKTVAAGFVVPRRIDGRTLPLRVGRSTVSLAAVCVSVEDEPRTVRQLLGLCGSRRIPHDARPRVSH